MSSAGGKIGAASQLAQPSSDASDAAAWESAVRHDATASGGRGSSGGSNGSALMSDASEGEGEVNSPEALRELLTSGSKASLSRPQRAFLGRVRYAMMEAIQVIGKGS